MLNPMAFIFTLTDAVWGKPSYGGSTWACGACPCRGCAWASKFLEPHRCGTETAKLTLQK